MHNIIYAPYLLKSMSEICKTFGVGPGRVKEWVKANAPIAVEGVGAKTRYSSELTRLQLWRENRPKASS